MQRRPAAGRLRVIAGALISALVVALPQSTYGQEQRVTICHQTGSPTNPWVFMTIDISNWPEFEARGAVRAASLADCPAPAPTPAPATQPAQPQAPQQPTALPATPIPTAIVAPPTAVPAATRVPQPTVAPTAAVEVAGAAAAEANQPHVSTLPKSGGEPDRLTLVLALLGIAALGVSMQRLARGRS